jgi:TRAP-type C4-dicarboxylate transport system permease large subunit
MTLFAVWVAGALLFLAWVTLKVWTEGWDPKWQVWSQLVFAALWALLWPLVIVILIWAVLVACFERRY